MSAIDTLRDALFGNPPQPNKEPSREGVLAAFTELQQRVIGVASGVVPYPTVASLPSDAPIGSQARVYADPDDTNNTYWIRTPTSGPNNGWVIDQDYLDEAARVVQPLVEDATTAAQQATAAADEVRGLAPATKAQLGSDYRDVHDITAGTTEPNTATSPNPFIWIPSTGIEAGGIATEVALRVEAGGTGEVLLLEPAGATFRVVANIPVTVTAGLNTITIPDGPYLPAGSRAAYKKITSSNVRHIFGTGLWDRINLDDDTSVGAVLTLLGQQTFTPAISLTVKSSPTAVEPRVAALEQYDVAALAARVGDQDYWRLRTFGWPMGGASTTGLERTNYSNRALAQGERLRRVQVDVKTIGAGAIIVATPNAARTQITPLARYDVAAVATGPQYFDVPDDPNFPDAVYPAGSLVGYWVNDQRLAFTNNTVPDGDPVYLATLDDPQVGVTRSIEALYYKPAFSYEVESVVPLTEQVQVLREEIDEIEITPPPGKYPASSPGNALYSWRAKAARIASGAAAQAKIILLGSSSAHQYPIPKALCDIAQDALGLSAQGWISMTDDAGWQALLNGATIEYSSGWSQIDMGSGLMGVDGFALTTATSGETITIEHVKCTAFRLYSSDDAGVFRYRVDGGAWETVTAEGAPNRRSTVVSGLADAAHTVEIETISGTVRILGLYCYGTGAGVEVSKAGNGATLASHWAALAPQVTGYMADIQPDVAVVVLSRNDWRNSIPPATFKANLLTLIAAIKTGHEHTAIVLFAQPRTTGGPQAWPETAYRDVIRQVSDADPMVEYLSGLDLFADAEVMFDLGATQGDRIHLTDAGGRIIATELWDRLLRVPGG